MLEALLSGDEQIEEKYLHNFSEGEKEAFRSHVKRSRKHMAKYQARLDALIAEDSPAIFCNDDPKPICELDVKYVLNRIAANDPRDTAFELGRGDLIQPADWWALEIAKAFQNNTVCHRVILQDLGMTEKGLAPILHMLRRKRLSVLDIRGNKMKDPVSLLGGVLSDPTTHWEEVRLGKIKLAPDQSKELAKYPNLSFNAVTPLSTKVRDVCDALLGLEPDR